MANECLNAALEQLRKVNTSAFATKFDQEEVKQMLNALNEIRNTTLESAGGDDGIYTVKAQQYLTQQRRARERRFRNLNDGAIKEVALARELGAARNPSRALIDRLNDTERNIFGNMALLPTFSGWMRREAINANLDPSALRKIASTGVMDKEIKQAMFALSNNQPLTNIPKEAEILAKLFKRGYDAEFDMKTSAGIAVDKRKNYHYPSMTSRNKLEDIVKSQGEAAARARFVQVEFDALDLDVSFNGLSKEEIKDSIGRTFDDIMEDGMEQIRATDALMFNETIDKNVSSFSKSRNWVYKSADLQHERDLLWGSDNLMDTFTKQVERTSRWSALVETFGTDPKQALNNVASALERQTGSELKDLSRARIMLDDLMGRNNIPMKNWVPKTASYFRALTSMALQGATFFVSLTDMGSFAHNLRQETGETLLSSVGESFRAARLTLKSEERKQFAEMTGAMIDATLGDLAHRIGMHHHDSKMMSRLLSFYFQFNLLSPFTDAMKVGQSAALSNRLAGLGGTEFVSLSDGMKKSFARSGIDASDWQTIRKAVDKGPDGRQYVTLEKVDDLLSPEQARILKRKLAGYFNEQAMIATPIPGAETRAVLRFGSADRDSAYGALVDMSTQFLSFPVSITQKNIKKTVLNGGAESVSQAFSREYAGRTMAELAQFTTTLMAFAYLGDVAREATRNRTPRDPRDPEVVLDMFTRSGAGGIYADIVTNLAAGRGFVPTSPLERTLNDLGSTTGDIVGAAFSEDKELGDVNWKRARRAIMNLAPFQNHFALKGALDYYILYNMNESSNPGYLNRLESRMDDVGQEPLFTRDIAR